MDLGLRCSTPAEIYVGLLAATILFLATNAGIIGVSRLVYSMGIHRQMPDAPAPAAPEVPHAVDRHPASSAAIACLAMLPGQATSSATSTRSARCCRSRSPTSSVIRAADHASRTSRARTAGPGNVTIRGVRRAAVRDRRRHRHRPGVHRRHASCTRRGDRRRRLAAARASSSTSSSAAARAWTSTIDAQGRDPAAGRRPRGGVRLGARRRRRRRVLRRARWPPRSSSPRGGAAASTCWSRSPCRTRSPIDARDARAGGGRRSRSSSRRALQGGRRVTGHFEKVRAGQAGRRIIEEAEDMRAPRDRDAAAARATGASLFGKTLETVLAERPCRVIIESDGARETATPQRATRPSPRARTAREPIRRCPPRARSTAAHARAVGRDARRSASR